MFTGIIKAIGTVEENCSHELLISSSSFRDRMPMLGASIAVNGVCLTVSGIVEQPQCMVKFDLGQETQEKTLLAQLKRKEEVNLEPSLCFGDAFDGHMVQGHVDAVVTLIKKVDSPQFCHMTFSFGEDLALLLVKKGSIAVNGVSLTINEIAQNTFTVGLVPYTLEHTCLKNLQEGNMAHVETDVLGRYIAHLAKPYFNTADMEEHSHERCPT